MKQNPGVSGCCRTISRVQTEFCLCVTSESQRGSSSRGEGGKDNFSRVLFSFFLTTLLPTLVHTCPTVALPIFPFSELFCQKSLQEQFYKTVNFVNSFDANADHTISTIFSAWHECRAFLNIRRFSRRFQFEINFTPLSVGQGFVGGPNESKWLFKFK